MVVSVRAKSQITLPSQLVKKLEIKEGDEFEAIEKDGGIFLMPVVTYPKEYIDSLIKEGDRAYVEVKAGKRPIFKNADEMMKYLESH